VTDRFSERRIALAIIGASVALFLALFAIQGPAFESPDEAKYVGLGLNILAGRGLVTDFGAPILYHAPVWPLLLAIPKAWLGLDPLAVGHVMEAVAGAIAIVFAAALAWRYRPAAGAVTAAALIATPYLANLARSAGIDLPATAFVLAFLWVAPRAIERDSLRLGLLAGVLFGAGFLMKETVIPFGPVPFLAALLGAAPARTIGRISAAALLTTAVATSWWFVLYAQITGSVYRVGGPAWLLLPLALLVALAVVAGLSFPRFAGTGAGRALEARLAGRRSGVLRALVAWGGLGLWLLAQLALYAFAAKLGGAALVRVNQLLGDLRTYFPQIGMVVTFGVVGAILALRAARSQAVWQLLLAGVVQIPLIILVLGIGETPRHYVATLCIGAALGGVGFVAVSRRAFDGADRWLLAAAAGLVAVAGAAQLLHARHLPMNAPRAAAISVAVIVAIGLARWLWLRIEPRAIRAGPRTIGAIALVGVLLVGGGIATAVAVRRSASDDVATRTRAITEIGDWVRANVPAGQTVTIGNALAYELALELHDHVHVVRELPERARADRSTQTGLRLTGSDDLWPLTLEGSLRVVDSLDAYEAGHLARELRSVGAVLWIEAGYLDAPDDTTPLTEALRHATGATQAMRWTYPHGARTIVVTVFRIDPSQLAFQSETTFAEAQAVDVLAGLLKQNHAAQAASTFLQRLVLVPPGDPNAALARLRSVAAP
jgi:4-amino-4-deoxy-L-arabinose transferase-like glycosyltransferase